MSERIAPSSSRATVGDSRDGRATLADDDSRAYPEETIGDLVGRTAEDATGFLRAEVSLARAELQRDLVSAAKGAGALSVFAFMGYLGALLFAFGAAWALAMVIPTGAAFAAVGAALVVIGLPLAAFAARQVKKIEPLPRTRRTLNEMAEEKPWNPAPKS